MQSDESTGGESLRPDRSTASEDTTPGDKNPGDWRPDREVVADIRRQLLDGDSARALAEQYPVGKDAILSLAKHGRGTGAIGPRRALSTTGRWVPADTPVTDGGLPDHIGRINGLGDGPDWYRCQECGATGATLEAIDHHERCPGERAVATDGGEYTVTTEEITVVDGVEVDITVRDTGAGNRPVDHTLTELKMHLGRIATAFEQRTPPLELEEIPDQNKPMFGVAWDRVLDDGSDDPEPVTDDDDDGDSDECAVEQQGLDGGAHEGQATLDGGVTREVQR